MQGEGVWCENSWTVPNTGQKNRTEEGKTCHFGV